MLVINDENSDETHVPDALVEPAFACPSANSVEILRS